MEGWHWGTEWINSGSLVERVNFASVQLGDLEKPGVQAMVDGILSEGNSSLPPDVLIDRAFDQLAMTAISDDSRTALIEFIEEQDRREGTAGQNSRERAVSVLKMAATTPEFQRT